MRGLQFVGLSLLALIASRSAQAQTASAAGATPSSGDITVTATKRPQTLRQTPISVAVTDAGTVERAQIRDLIDLPSVVPSLEVKQENATGQTNFYIRGFGNGAGNDGIESSVGVFIDGVYRSRASSALDDLPEIDQIEVLRGPQSTLFGKNVSAGAISITTVRPQFTFGGGAQVSTGNYGLGQTRATITGPLTDTLAFRLSGNLDEREGFDKNDVTGKTVNNRNRWSMRGDLLWKPTARISVRIIADYNEIHEACCAAFQLQNGPSTQAIKALGYAVSNPAAPFSRNLDFNTDPENRLLGRGLSAEADDDLGFARLTSITAYRDQTNTSNQDVDFTGDNLANEDQGDDDRTFTQELRLTSQGAGPLKWLAGAFYDRDRLNTGQNIVYGDGLYAYANALAHGAVTELETLQHRVTPSIIPGSTYFQAGQGISDFYKMNQDSWSLFGQADYQLTSRLTLTGGLAYLSDHKRAESDVALKDPFSSLNLNDVPQLAYLHIPVNAFAALNQLQFFYAGAANHAPVNFPNANESGVLDGDKLTYAARLAYDLGLANLYISYNTGWKAGAYNLSAGSRPPGPSGVGRTTQPENVTVYEMGLKAALLGGGGYFNIAIFDQAVADFQVNEYSGLGYDLVNAGKEEVKGVEIDTAYEPVQWLALTGAVTYLDPRYDSFANAPCYQYDTPATCPNGIFSAQNLSGTRPAGIPTWSASVSATVSRELADGWGSFLRGEFDYESPHQVDSVVPPDLSTYGVDILNASLGFTNARRGLKILLWGRNLTDYAYVVDAFPSVAQAGSYTGFLNDPRTYGVTLSKTF